MPSFPDNATETETTGNETLSQALTSAGYVFDPCEDSTTCEMGQFDIQINFGVSNSVTQVIHVETLMVFTETARKKNSFILYTQKLLF